MTSNRLVNGVTLSLSWHSYDIAGPHASTDASSLVRTSSRAGRWYHRDVIEEVPDVVVDIAAQSPVSDKMSTPEGNAIQDHDLSRLLTEWELPEALTFEHDIERGDSEPSKGVDGLSRVRTYESDDGSGDDFHTPLPRFD